MRIPLFSCRGSLFHPTATYSSRFFGHYGTRIGKRAPSLLLALLVEALLISAILTLGSSFKLRESKDSTVTVVRFKAAAYSHQTTNTTTVEPKPGTKPVDQRPAPKATPLIEAVAPLAKPPKAPEPSFIRLSPQEMVATDIAMQPRQSNPSRGTNQPMMGPPDTGVQTRDTPQVSGSGPNGEPLYAASWYREPYEDELRGYLSTASGPGWGLIACRTAPDFRVEDCVKIDEYPTGSNIARSVLAAAWQFRVRPPRIGGEPKIGEWVRIRIDYEFGPGSRQ